MSYKNGIISEEDFNLEIANIYGALDNVKKILKISEKGASNPKFPYQISPSAVKNEIEKLEEDKKILLKQYSCTHENTTGLVYIGHDSHKDYYENKCIDCGFILGTDQY